MATWLPTAAILLLLGPLPAESKFVQLAPIPRPAVEGTPVIGHTRALVLIPGYHPHPFSESNRARPDFHSWQNPGSLLVKTLAMESDVYAFAYGETLPVTDIATLPSLLNGVHTLRALGYREVVLVGFSAGGVIARHFVEDLPDAGVTKVVQVCAPNAGSGWARASRDVFTQSLSPKARARVLEQRKRIRIPETVEFVCIVATGLGRGDGVVSTRSQWSQDLQAQGIPARLVHTEHLRVARSEAGAQLVREVVRESYPRWSAARVNALRMQLWGTDTPDK